MGSLAHSFERGTPRKHTCIVRCEGVVLIRPQAWIAAPSWYKMVGKMVLMVCGMVRAGVVWPRPVTSPLVQR